MKKILSKTMMLVALAATLLSFTIFGGEGFEIYLNNKVVMQQYGKTDNAPKALRLNQYAANDELTVKYHHCGKVGKSRVITIKDAQNRILREWRYADAAQPVAPMVCKVKDILSLSKGNETTLKLYYRSTELTTDRMLTTLVIENNVVAKSGR
jgi:hypothetical protein